MLEAFGVSDPGCVRNNNEDCYLLSPQTGLYVVADGMGGAQAGEHASQLAVDTLADVIGKAEQTSPEMLARAFQEANNRVMRPRRPAMPAWKGWERPWWRPSSRGLRS